MSFFFFFLLLYVCQWREIVEGTGRRADGGRVQIGSSKTVMQSKYLDQRQEVIMRKFCCSLPVLTSMTLRAFGAGSGTGHTLYFPLKDQFETHTHTAWRGGREGGVMRWCEWCLLIICKSVELQPPQRSTHTSLPRPYCYYGSVLEPKRSIFSCGGRGDGY